MNKKLKNNGSVMLVAVFAIALLSTLVMGILQMNTEEIQLMQNQVYSARTLAVAEAGLNEAFSELRTDSGWTAGFAEKAIGAGAEGGTYTVTVTGALPNLTVESVGSSDRGFDARVSADVTVGASSPYVIRVDNLRINE